MSIGLEDRVRALEVQVAATKSDLLGHIVLCDARSRVMWKMGALLSGVVALVISAGVAFMRP
jgi:hypothetical protein